MPTTDRELIAEDLDRVSFSINDLREVLLIIEHDQLDANDRQPLGMWIETLRETARHIA